MIVLDTNVLSEPLRVKPDARVLAWMTNAKSVHLTSITVGEILAGVRALPAGRRRQALANDVEAALDTFRDRILPYDHDAARRYAELTEVRRRAGRSLSVEDGMIASVCLVHGASLATRNLKDFEGLGLGLVDPWQA